MAAQKWCKQPAAMNPAYRERRMKQQLLDATCLFKLNVLSTLEEHESRPLLCFIFIYLLFICNFFGGGVSRPLLLLVFLWGGGQRSTLEAPSRPHGHQRHLRPPRARARSVVAETASLRLELLGLNFTYQAVPALFLLSRWPVVAAVFSSSPAFFSSLPFNRRELEQKGEPGNPGRSSSFLKGPRPERQVPC